MKKIISVLLLGSLFNLAYADAPVVDYSSDIGTSAAKSSPVKSGDEVELSKPSQPIAISKSNLSAEQRINKLEQQINNLNSQNSSVKIEELQQRLQKLNGQLEDQTHQVEQLSTQLKDFYQDLNQRLDGAKPGTAANPVKGADKATVATTPVVSNATLIPATASNVAGAFAGSETKKGEAVKPANPDSSLLKEQQMYQTAIDLLPDKKYEASETKLREYLKSYPKGAYVANAHYWLGEINFLQKNFDAAEEEFKIVVDKFPKSKRISDAALKLALVHQNQGREAAKTKQELRKIVTSYPGTSAAQLAKQQLSEA